MFQLEWKIFEDVTWMPGNGGAVVVFGFACKKNGEFCCGSGLNYCCHTDRSEERAKWSVSPMAWHCSHCSAA